MVERLIRNIVVGVLSIAMSCSAAAQQVVKKDGSIALQQSDRPITQLIVKYKDDTVQSFDAFQGSGKTARLAAKNGVALSYKRQMSGMAHVLALPQSLSRAEAIALTKRLEMDSNVVFAEPDEWVYPAMVPNDPGYTGAPQWHYFAPSTASGNAGGINAPAAWDINRGQDVIVAVIDTGVASHPDLAANVIGGYDFIGDDQFSNDGSPGRDADASDPGDWRTATDCPAPNNTQTNSSWHGTHVSGTIAAVTNNSLGVAGVAYEARILPLRVLGRCGGYSSDSADAIQWAAGLAVPNLPVNPNIAKVINLSLGSANPCSNTTQSAITAARAAGAVVVAATGNAGNTSIGQPASCQGVIAVTAHTFQGDNASYANVGPGTTISAPGGGSCTTPDGAGFICSTANSTASTNQNFWIWSTSFYGITTPNSQNAAMTASGPAYAAKIGTSMATPHVSGVAALLASRMPALTPDEIAFLITSSARPHPAGLFCAMATAGTCGSGLLDAAAALMRLSDRTPMLTLTPSAAVVAGGQTAILTAVATPRNGGSTAFTYTWAQTSGPSVLLTNSTTATPSFTATNPGGVQTFNLTLRDGNGYRVTQTVSIRSNNAATITPVTLVSVAQGSSVTFNVSATDPENDTLTYVATNLPAGATFSAAQGQFSWQNVAAAPGTYTFDVVAYDGTVNSTPVSVTISVTAPATPVTPAATGGGGGGAASAIQLLALAWLLGLLTLAKSSRNYGKLDRALS